MELGQQMEVRGGGFGLLLKGACTTPTASPQAEMSWVSIPASIQAAFRETAIEGGSLPREVGADDPHKVPSNSEMTVYLNQVFISSCPRKGKN